MYCAACFFTENKKNGNNGIILQKLQVLQCYIFTLGNILVLNLVILLNFTEIFFLHRCFFYAQTVSLLQYMPKAHRGLTLHACARSAEANCVQTNGVESRNTKNNIRKRLQIQSRDLWSIFLVLKESFSEFTPF